jgi:Flp pilus assembly pilin Flp
MLGPLAINPAAATRPEPAGPQPGCGPRPRRQKRRGVTAMEYCVVASVIIAVLVLVVQHIGGLVAPMFTKASAGTQANSTSTGS